MKIKLILTICTLLIVINSCKDSKTNEVTEKNLSFSLSYDLIGKKAVLTYPQLKAEVEYIDDHTLHWLQKDEKGNTFEGTEQISYKKLNNHQFFLNWIEADGYTVSQVIDLQYNTVTAYLSYDDEKSKSGGRGADFAKGTIEILK